MRFTEACASRGGLAVRHTKLAEKNAKQSLTQKLIQSDTNNNLIDKLSGILFVVVFLAIYIEERNNILDYINLRINY